MKKIVTIFIMFAMVFLGLSIKSNAALGPIVTQEVNSQALYNTLSKKQSYKGKTYKSGIIDNYRIVETSGVADLKKDQIICDLTNLVEVESSSITITRTKMNSAPTFVAFDEVKVKEAYAYILLNGLGLCTDEYTTSQTTTDYVFYSYAADQNLCSTSMSQNNASYTFKSIPEGTKKVKLVLKGDVIAVTLTIKNYQKLWFGHDKNFEQQVNAYICCNTYEYEYFE